MVYFTDNMRGLKWTSDRMVKSLFEYEMYKCIAVIIFGKRRPNVKSCRPLTHFAWNLKLGFNYVSTRKFEMNLKTKLLSLSSVNPVFTETDILPLWWSRLECCGNTLAFPLYIRYPALISVQSKNNLRLSTENFDDQSREIRRAHARWLTLTTLQEWRTMWRRLSLHVCVASN